MGIFDFFKKRAQDDTPRSAAEWIPRLGDEDPGVREEAARRLGGLGAEGREARGALTTALDDRAWRVRLEAADALVKVGGDVEKAMRTLGILLENEDAAIRRDAATQIGRSAERAEPAAPALVRALADGDEAVVQAAVAALRQVGRVAVPALVEALKSGPAEARGGAAAAVVTIAPVAMPTFIAMTDDEDRDTRLIGALGLADLIPAEETLEHLLAALRHQDAFFRAWAARTLGLLGPEIEAEAGDPLEAARDRDPDPEVREEARASLEKIRG
jgi:HEAT repeat protein